MVKLKDFDTHFSENGKQRYKLMVLAHEFTYFFKYETKDKRCYTEYEIISILEFLIYIIYIFVQFGRHNFQRIIGILVGINCVPLLADLTFINDESNTILKEYIFFYFIMIKQIRTIIDRNSISLRRNSIVDK